MMKLSEAIDRFLKERNLKCCMDVYYRYLNEIIEYCKVNGVVLPPKSNWRKRVYEYFHHKTNKSNSNNVTKDKKDDDSNMYEEINNIIERISSKYAEINKVISALTQKTAGFGPILGFLRSRIYNYHTHEASVNPVNLVERALCEASIPEDILVRYKDYVDAIDELINSTVNDKSDIPALHDSLIYSLHKINFGDIPRAIPNIINRLTNILKSISDFIKFMNGWEEKAPKIMMMSEKISNFMKEYSELVEKYKKQFLELIGFRSPAADLILINKGYLRDFAYSRYRFVNLDNVYCLPAFKDNIHELHKYDDVYLFSKIKDMIADEKYASSQSRIPMDHRRKFRYTKKNIVKWDDLYANIKDKNGLLNKLVECIANIKANRIKRRQMLLSLAKGKDTSALPIDCIDCDVYVNKVAFLESLRFAENVLNIVLDAHKELDALLEKTIADNEIVNEVSLVSSI